MDDRQAWSKAGEGRWRKELADGTIATLRVDHWEALLGPSDDLGYWSRGENDLGIEAASRDEAVAYVSSALADWQHGLGLEPGDIDWAQAPSGEPVSGTCVASDAPGSDGEAHLACVAPMFDLVEEWVGDGGTPCESVTPMDAGLDARTRFTTGAEWAMREADAIFAARLFPER